MVFAVPMLVTVGVIRGELKEFRNLNSRWFLALATCGFFLFFHWLTWFVAVQRTTLANSMVFFAISPFFTAIGAWFFFREPFERRHVFASILCFAGVGWIFHDSLSFEHERLMGDALALFSSVLFSCYFLLSKGIRRGLGNFPFTIVTYTSCGLVFAMVLAARGELAPHFDRNTWIALVLLAVGPTLLGHALFTFCLQYFNANLISILILTEPVIGSVTAYFVLGEPIKSGVIMGFLVIATGISGLFLPSLLAKKSFKA
jgi:drug/metabolite transporter (DMT)-like permease